MPAAYLTLEHLSAAIGQQMVLRLLDDDRDGIADAAAVEKVLIGAEREVGGYVGTKLPMAALLADAAATEHLASIAVHVAAELAYRRRTEFLTRDGTPYAETYKREVQKLKDIAANKYRIDINGVPAAPATSGGLVTNPASSSGRGGIIVQPLQPGAFTGGFGDY